MKPIKYKINSNPIKTKLSKELFGLKETNTRPKSIPPSEAMGLVNLVEPNDMLSTCSGHECFLKRTGVKCSRCK